MGHCRFLCPENRQSARHGLKIYHLSGERSLKQEYIFHSLRRIPISFYTNPNSTNLDMAVNQITGCKADNTGEMVYFNRHKPPGHSSSPRPAHNRSTKAGTDPSKVSSGN